MSHFLYLFVELCVIMYIDIYFYVRRIFMSDKLRAVYYCRVSTDDENQATSIVNQRQESIKIIEENKWDLVDEYVDEGKSGTTTKKRDEYNRLFKDMETGKFDIIVIKSQDRLMRNTKEWYFFIDKLVQNNKKLYFYLDRKFYSPDDALITGIKAILAEDYSRNLSKNINNAHKKRQESGSNVVITSNTWGYDKVNKEVVINEKEAEMIRFIYEMAAQNNGSRTIAKMLEDNGYKNRNGGKIAEQTVRKIIRNPLYKGTAVMNKLHKNFETKKVERNSEDKWIYHENIIPAIVSDELWNKANSLMDNRSQQFITEDFKERIIGRKKNLYPLSGKIECGLCGQPYWRRTANMAHERQYYWSCREYIARGRKTKNNRSAKGAKEEKYILAGAGCDNIHIKEKDLENVIYQIAEYLYGKSKNDVASIAIKIMQQVIEGNAVAGDKEEQLKINLNKINTNREKLLDKYLDGNISDDIYKLKEEKYQQEISKIKALLKEQEKQKASLKEKTERLKDIENEILEIANRDISIKNMQQHIEKIVVFPDSLLFKFDIFDDIKVDVFRVNYKRVEYNIFLHN